MQQTVKLYNTLSRSVEVFEPIEQGHARIYCCGPTVYNYQHIGNLRTYVFEDLLVRTLRYANFRVTHVMNITDVGHLVSDADEGEDKMALAAKREGKRSAEIASFYTDIFFDHCSWLNIERPSVVCKATDHISQMIELIRRLEVKGIAYQRGGNVYFDVERFANYGELARLDLDSLKAGARIEIDQEKKNPLDFALWFTRSKFERQELQWDSPWGMGYPGWHIECSAMAMHYLGESFDIHCGGIDHIPVHHTNEIAQSEAATGKRFARFWMHGGFLVTDKQKMSKSAGEFLTLDVLRDKGFDPVSYRLLCLSGNYRHELAWSWDALESASNTLAKLQRSVRALRETAEVDSATSLSDEGRKLEQAFGEAIFNDLGMPRALAVMHQLIQSSVPASEKLSLLEKFDSVLGLGIKDWLLQEEQIPREILSLVEEREAARLEKNFARADDLRKELATRGFVIEDSKSGPKVRRKE